MKRLLRDMIRSAFDIDNLIESMNNIIEGAIDYDEIATQILDDIDIEEVALEVAIDKLEEAPF